MGWGHANLRKDPWISQRAAAEDTFKVTLYSHIHPFGSATEKKSMGPNKPIPTQDGGGEGPGVIWRDLANGESPSGIEEYWKAVGIEAWIRPRALETHPNSGIAFPNELGGAFGCRFAVAPKRPPTRR